MKISIVVPSFNQADYLEECLLSILSQNVKLELIVMDGGSTDHSTEIIEKYQDKIAYWQSKPDGGQAMAIREGFRICSGDILYWLNSDDRCTTDSLVHVLKFFEDNPRIEWAFGNSHKINQSGNLISRRFVPKTKYSELLQTDLFLPQEATFFRKDFYFKVGEINPNYHYALDYELWLRMAKTSRPGKIKHFLGEFRVQALQKSQDVNAYMNEVFKARIDQGVGADFKRFSFFWRLKRKISMFTLRFLDSPLRFMLIERPRECLQVFLGTRLPGQSRMAAGINLLIYILPFGYLLVKQF